MFSLVNDLNHECKKLSRESILWVTRLFYSNFIDTDAAPLLGVKTSGLAQ